MHRCFRAWSQVQMTFQMHFWHVIVHLWKDNYNTFKIDPFKIYVYKKSFFVSQLVASKSNLEGQVANLEEHWPHFVPWSVQIPVNDVWSYFWHLWGKIVYITWLASWVLSYQQQEEQLLMSQYAYLYTQYQSLTASQLLPDKRILMTLEYYSNINCKQILTLHDTNILLIFFCVLLLTIFLCIPCPLL